MQVSIVLRLAVYQKSRWLISWHCTQFPSLAAARRLFNPKQTLFRLRPFTFYCYKFCFTIREFSFPWLWTFVQLSCVVEHFRGKTFLNLERLWLRRLCYNLQFWFRQFSAISFIFQTFQWIHWPRFWSQRLLEKPKWLKFILRRVSTL